MARDYSMNRRSFMFCKFHLEILIYFFYLKVYQIRVKYLLEGIDNLKESIKIPPVNILRRITASFSHSSCAIEVNKLSLVETRDIWKSLNKNYDLDRFLN